MKTTCPIIVQYSSTKDFTVPCKAIHPDIKVKYEIENSDATVTFESFKISSSKILKDIKLLNFINEIDVIT